LQWEREKRRNRSGRGKDSFALLGGRGKDRKFFDLGQTIEKRPGGLIGIVRKGRGGIIEREKSRQRRGRAGILRRSRVLRARNLLTSSENGGSSGRWD